MKCEIVRDLLPLYQDGVCSEESRQVVDGHLPDCDACSATLQAIRAEMQLPCPVPVEQVDASTAMRALLHRWQRSKLTVAITCVVATLILVVVAMRLHTYLFKEPNATVTSSQVELAYIYRRSDDSIALRLRLKDGKAPDGDSWGTQRYLSPAYDGDTYMYIGRPYIILDTKFNALTGELELRDDPNDPMERLYYGTHDDRILLWEQGMELPTLTEKEAEAYFADIINPLQ